MCNEILVSIIVPVYNAEKYLETCISSLLNQTYQNIEIILVDDGSSVVCRNLCDALRDSNSKVRVIHQQNQGVSAARNAGTANANGQYITYVDADDILNNDCIRHGIELITSNDSDMVMGAIKKIYDYSEFNVNSECDKILSECLDQNEFDKLRAQYFNQSNRKFINIKGDGFFNRGPYARIIKANIAKSVLFNKDYKIGEDFLWNLELLNKCEKVCISYNIWYGYFIYASSAIRRYYGNREEFVSAYLVELYNNNNDYCRRNKSDYIKAVSVEFYCVLNFELMSQKCPMSKKEKNIYVKHMIKKFPWKSLFAFKSFFSLGLKHKLLILSVKLNLWQHFLSLKK